MQPGWVSRQEDMGTPKLGAVERAAPHGDGKRCPEGRYKAAVGFVAAIASYGSTRSCPNGGVFKSGTCLGGIPPTLTRSCANQSDLASFLTDPSAI